MQKKYAIAIIIAFVAMAILFMSINVIGPTERGIVIRATTGVVDKVHQPGIVVTLPFYEHLRTYETSPIELQLKFGVDDNGAVTKDMQTVGMTATIFYQYEESQLIELAHKYTSESIKKIFQKELHASSKAVIGQYSIYDIVNQQSEISAQVENKLKTALNSLDGQPIKVANFSITNWDWSDDFDRQVTETMRRAQQVKQAEQELLITANKSQNRVKEAQADSMAQVIKADAELVRTQKRADGIRLEADAIAYKNEQIAKNINVEIKLKELEIEMKRVEKWNGVYVPNNHYGPIPVSTGTILGGK